MTRFLPHLFALSALLLCSREVSAQEMRFGLTVHVASEGDAPVVDEAWIDTQVDRANQIFAPSETSFERVDRRDLAPEHTTLITRGHRHQLGPYVADGEIHVFVVKALGDVDQPGEFIRGVHWRSRRGGGPRHYVILSSIAGPHVLAHELGHFFGNPHSPTPGNIMSYARGRGLPFFDAQQLRRIARHRIRFVDRNELRLLPSGRPE